MNRYALGTDSWSGWTSVPGATRATSAPATTGYGGDLRLFVRGPWRRIDQKRLGL